MRETTVCYWLQSTLLFQMRFLFTQSISLDIIGEFNGRHSIGDTWWLHSMEVTLPICRRTVTFQLVNLLLIFSLKMKISLRFLWSMFWIWDIFNASMLSTRYQQFSYFCVTIILFWELDHRFAQPFIRFFPALLSLDHSFNFVVVDWWLFMWSTVNEIN